MNITDIAIVGLYIEGGGVPLEGVIADILTATWGKYVRRHHYYSDSQYKLPEIFLLGMPPIVKIPAVVVTTVFIKELLPAIKTLSQVFDIKEILALIDGRREKTNFLKVNGEEIPMKTVLTANSFET